MLVLKRQRNESIVIGDDITVTIVEIGSDAVRIGVEAPRHILVDRTEVRARREKEEKCCNDGR